MRAPKIGFTDLALTAGETGVSSGQTVIVALLPVLLRRYARSNFWIGFAVAGEGVFALALPFLVGIAVDRLPRSLARRFGRHSFFLLAAMPVMASALVLLPFAHGYWLMTGLAFAFFAAHQSYRTPLMTLIVDAMPDEKRARVQGARSVYHAVGLAYGLVAAGLLFSIWKPLPFIVASVLVVLSTAVTVSIEKRTGGRERHGGASLSKQLEKPFRELAKNRAAVWILGANALWDGAASGIRPYFFVFAMVVVGVSVATASLGLIALVASIVASSIVFGRLGDEHDRTRLLEYALPAGVLALGAGFFVRGIWVAVVVLLLAGLAAGATTTLFYPVFAQTTGERDTGQHSGIFAVSVGLGRVVAPMVVGAAIDLGAHFTPHTRGYPFMWPAAALFAALAWLSIRRARAHQGKRTRSGEATD